ncbi:hypothetical protein LR002_01045, partial [Candidatus Gracilibacteria bacterium]|nr:hypothetical protein [Candidatus Gracilibacteria bacterium]
KFQAYAYQFYIPEITNTSQKISGTIPTFVGKYIPKDSQLFFYSSENGNDEFRINDIPKNYTKIHTGYSLGGSNTDFSDTSDKIKNLVQLVDNSMLHHKIRPSSFSGSLAGGFKYSPVYHFPKSGTGYLKYFYIDSKGNIIGGKQKEFKIGTGTIITFNNFTNESNEIITDSVQPFIYGNYEPDEVINGSIVGNGKIQSIAIKTDLNGNFKFQPREKLKEGETYTINLNGGQKKLNILENKNIPEIISHTSGNIEVGKRPIFFGNGKPGEDIKIEVFNEDQYVNSTSTGFSNIKCKKLTASNGYKKTFTGTDVYSCSELGNTGSIIPFSTTGITIKDNGNWTWQLDKDLQEIETDSINIYFVKVYYSDDPEHYDLISFRYFPKKEPQTFAGAFASSGNYLKIDGDFAQIDLPKSGNSDRKNILEVFEKSGTGTIKVFSGSDLNYGIILPPFSGIKFGTGISSSGILVERGMRLYTKRNQQMELILRDKILNLKEGDKIFSGPKESTIKIFKPLEFFSFGKVKIFPDEKNISVKLNKNLDFNFEDFDKRNLGFFEKIWNYFSENSSGANKKYSSNPMGLDNDSRFTEYQKNIQTIIPDDKYSSDKSFKIADSLNGKTIKGGDKILIKGTAWPNTQIKFSVDGEAMGTTTTDGSGTFLFRLPKGFKAKYGTFDNNIKTIKIDNIEQKNLSKELIVSISNNSTGTYLQENEILNKDRNFEKKNGFINFTEKIMKLPIFGW